MAEALRPFDEPEIRTEAEATDGFHDYGDPVFEAPLRVLLEALAEAPLTPLGTGLLRRSVVRSLANRLRLEFWFREHPEIAHEEIHDPIVIVGMMRSGTTLMQRLVAADPRFYCTLGWETLAPVPPVDWQPGKEDPRVAAGEARDASARRHTPELFAIHPTHAHEAEEEIIFLADAFLSHVPESSCHLGDYRTWLDAQDFTPAYAHLYRVLQLLQWQKKQRGEKRLRWVLKTPAHLGYLETLIATFPAAHIVHMHRDPVATIPSGASLNAALWRIHMSEVDPRQVGKLWIERMSWANQRALSSRKRLSGTTTRFSDVGFRQATTDPLETISRIYQEAGIEMQPEAGEAMRHWLAADAREGRPPHRYTAGDFGLSEAEISDRFHSYTSRFSRYIGKDTTSA